MEHKMEDDNTEFTIRPMRWYVLFVASTYNITNAMMWISMSPAANDASDYFDVGIKAISMFSMVYMIISIPMMFLATWLIEKYGLRFGLHLGCTIQFFAAATRLIGTCEFIPQEARYPLSITGQCLMAVAQPFAMGIPTKVSDSWFPPKERIAATTLTSMSSPIGVMLGQVISPSLVNGSSDIPKMNFTVCALCMAAAMTAILVPRRKAHHPVEQSSFLGDILKLIKNKNYVVLWFTIGGAVSLVGLYQAYLSQMLCIRGYSDKFSGMCAALMMVFGIIGSALATILATITKLYKEITKIMFGIAAILAVALAFCIQHEDVEAGIITCAIVFGFVGIAAYPIFLELSAECTYPMDEVKSGGFIVTSSQVTGIIMTVIVEFIAQPATDEIMKTQTCTTDPEEYDDVRDMTIPNFLIAGLMSLYALVFIIGVRVKYLRLEAEKAKMELARPQTPMEDIVISAITSEKK